MNSQTEGTNILDYCFCYFAYADDTTSFLKDKNTVRVIDHRDSIFDHLKGLSNDHHDC